MISLNLQDALFTALHLCIILFNLFGWVVPSLRKFNLILLCLTLFSWIGLGYFYGIGYCPFTDWQWAVKEKLGEVNLPNSFIKYFLDSIFKIDSNPISVDILTAGLFFFALAVSIYMNFLKKNL